MKKILILCVSLVSFVSVTEAQMFEMSITGGPSLYGADPAMQFENMLLGGGGEFRVQAGKKGFGVNMALGYDFNQNVAHALIQQQSTSTFMFSGGLTAYKTFGKGAIIHGGFEYVHFRTRIPKQDVVDFGNGTYYEVSDFLGRSHGLQGRFGFAIPFGKESTWGFHADLVAAGFLKQDAVVIYQNQNQCYGCQQRVVEHFAPDPIALPRWFLAVRLGFSVILNKKERKTDDEVK